MTRTFTSFDYILGAVLGVPFVAVVVVGLVSLRTQALLGVAGLLLGGLAALMTVGVVFAAGRGYVRVEVRDGVARFKRGLRRTLEVPLEGTTFSITFGNDYDFAPGPKVVSDRETSKKIRKVLGIIARVLSTTARRSSQAAPEVFAAVRIERDGDKTTSVLLPGVTKMSEVEELATALGVNSDSA